MKLKAIKTLRYLLIVLFLSYYAESTLFFHTHIFNWGTVTHSHPYWPSNSHSHSQNECQTIATLTNVVFTLAVAAAFIPMFKIRTLLYTPRFSSFAWRIITNCSLRAPPLSIC